MTVVDSLVSLVERLKSGRRALVAVDGPDAAGKTTLARELVARVARPALHASVDGWHHPREARVRRGTESPEGYYLDSYDHDALVRECVIPFVSGARWVRTTTFDHRADHEAVSEQEVARDAVLLLEGVFLLRPQLQQLWDLSVYLHVPESVTLARAVERDISFFGSEEELRRRYARRYLPGQLLYRQEAAPMSTADIVLDNSDPAEPVILRWPSDR